MYIHVLYRETYVRLMKVSLCVCSYRSILYIHNLIYSNISIPSDLQLSHEQTLLLSIVLVVAGLLMGAGPLATSTGPVQHRSAAALANAPRKLVVSGY